MQTRKIPVMAADDSRQYMLRENFEIYAKSGIPSGALEMHFHNFYEVMYIEEGEFSILLNNRTYDLKRGDFILIGINQMHHYRQVMARHKSSRRILLWITRPWLETLSDGEADLTECFARTETPAWHFSALNREQLTGCLSKLLYLENDPALSRPEIRLLQRSYITQFFVYFNRMIREQEASFSLMESSRDPMIRQLSDYIDAHIAEPLSLDSLAGVMHISKYHFIRSFKEMTGMTVHDFINQKRIIRACELMDEGLPLTLIHEHCGFTSYSAFYRNFKNIYGVSPREYRSFSPAKA